MLNPRPRVSPATAPARGAATLAACLGSLTNPAVAVVTVVVGQIQTQSGSDAMLLSEAGPAVAGVALYPLMLPGIDHKAFP